MASSSNEAEHIKRYEKFLQGGNFRRQLACKMHRWMLFLHGPVLNLRLELKAHSIYALLGSSLRPDEPMLSRGTIVQAASTKPVERTGTKRSKVAHLGSFEKALQNNTEACRQCRVLGGTLLCRLMTVQESTKRYLVVRNHAE